ncbi:hypothetical protein [Acidithrix ferrooxidans]|uniref:hypothetical protein n=1 Tax=Acidithrix ferrooxidans TaxID=1280514 RepID=UPI001269F89F|nr:hypothetical protein [Acidithrix ferrooxidans]
MNTTIWAVNRQIGVATGNTYFAIWQCYAGEISAEQERDSLLLPVSDDTTCVTARIACFALT